MKELSLEFSIERYEIFSPLIIINATYLFFFECHLKELSLSLCILASNCSANIIGSACRSGIEDNLSKLLSNNTTIGKLSFQQTT
jgi:hypothetical protein